MKKNGLRQKTGVLALRLDYLTWKDSEEWFARDPVVVIPVGSVEQHGPIGPLGTDYLIPEELARRIDARTEVLLLPVMPYGVCPGQLSFSGTIDIGYPAFLAVMNKIAESILQHGARRIVFLNGHGGNSHALDQVCLEVYRRGGLAAVADWWTLAPQLDPAWLGGHGDGQEASAVMAFRPELVDKSKLFDGEVHHLSERLQNKHLGLVKFGQASIRVIRDVRDVVSHGAYGGPDASADASAEWGEAMLSAVAGYLADFIDEFRKAPLSRPER